MDLIEQAERDLRWLVDCPDLLVTPASIRLPDPFLTNQPIDWSPVIRFHETKSSYRVGYYVEALVQAWLGVTPGIEEIQQGIQVRKEKITLGELDFLFRRDGELQHLEVALKFYLYAPDRIANGSHFIGPNAADNFERKRDRLLTKQLPFGRLYDPEIQRSQHLVKGVIFYPEGVSEIDEMPDNLNPLHARGTWQFYSEVKDRSAEMMAKPFWLDLGETRAVELTQPISHPCLFTDESGYHHFVVEDSWPL